MTDSQVNLPPVATTSGQQLDADVLSVGGINVLRERQRISGAAATDLAPVTSSGGLSVHVTDSPLPVVASTTGGAQLVAQSTTPWQVVSSTTGGNAPVTIQNTLPLQVVSSTTGGNAPVVVGNSTSAPIPHVASSTGGAQPVAQSSTPWLVVSSTTGGAVVVGQSGAPWTVVSSTTGGNAPVVVQNSTSAPILTVSSSTGGAQPCSQSSTPWVVVSSTTGGNAPVVVGNSTTAPVPVVASTTGGAIAVAQSSTPWLVVASTTGGAPLVGQSGAPWTVVSSTTGGAIAVGQSGAPWLVSSSTTASTVLATVRTTQPTAVADATVASAMLDSKGRQVVTINQVRQLISQANVQATSVETVILAGTSGTYHDLISLIVCAATSNALGCVCNIKDSSGGTTRFTLTLGTSTTALHNPIVMEFDPPWKHSTATSTGSAWTATLSAVGGAYISAQFADWTS